MKSIEREWLKSERDFHDEEVDHYEEGNLLGLPYAKLRNHRRIEVMAGLAPSREDSRLLEIGCGTGFILGPLMERLPSARCYGFDISRRMVERTRDTLQGFGGRARLFVGDAMAIPFQDATFDQVICVASLHHIPDVPRCLGEIARVLRPGGVFYLEEPLTSQAISLVRKALRKPEVLSPYERAGFVLPELLDDVQRVLTLAGHETFGTMSPVAKHIGNGSVVRALWAVDRAMASLPFSDSVALNVRLWARKEQA